MQMFEDNIINLIAVAETYIKCTQESGQLKVEQTSF
jgi:hypothetical protein